MVRHYFLATVAFLVFFMVQSSVLTAQDDARERRRKFIEDLLKTVNESQAIQNQLGDRGGNPLPPRDNRSVPAIPQNVIEARRQITELSGGLDQIVRTLYQASDKSPLLRSLSADALQIRAQCNAAAQAAATSADPQFIATNFALVDRQWRVFQHRLSQAPGLNREFRQLIDQVAATEANCCQLLGLSPQLDRTELVRQASSLSTSFEYLLQNLHFEARNNRSLAQCCRDGDGLLTELRQALALVDRGTHENIVDNFREFQSKWRRWLQDVRRIQSPRIQQDVANIEQICASMSDLLWLQPEFESEYVVDMLVAIRNETDALFSSITLNEMVLCDSPQQLVGAARDFQRTCAQLAGAAAVAEGPEELISGLRTLDAKWADFQGRLAPLKSPLIQSHVASCNTSLEQLRQIFGTRSEMNHEEIEHSIAELDELSHQLMETVAATVLRDRNYNAGLRQSLDQLTTQFHSLAHELHSGSTRDLHVVLKPGDLRSISGTWEQLRGKFSEIRDPHRQALGVLRAQIEPIIARLQVVFID